MARKRPTKTRSRGRFKSLRVSESFRDVFFGILAADVLYLKVDDSNRRDYEKVKSEAFHPFENRPMSMSYFSVPLSVLEASPTLAVWAKRSIAVARSGNRTTSRTRRGNRVRS